MANFLLGFVLASAVAAQGPGRGPNPSTTVRHVPEQMREIPKAAMAAQVAIPNTRRLDFTSAINGHQYSISIALPSEPPPAGGYRALYVLDGDYFFASVVEAVRLNASGVVVVGIGYPMTDEFVRSVMSRRTFYTGPASRRVAVSLERGFDLTLPSSAALLSSERLTKTAVGEKDVGGLDAFLKVVESEVKPMVAKVAPINVTNQAIFGYSLGGLAVVHAFFTEPNAFRSFIAASPSIWWADARVLANEASFSAQISQGRATPRLLVTVGADEELVHPVPGFSPEQVAAIIGNAKMVGNSRQLVDRLQKLRGGTGYYVEDLAVFPKQNHGPSAWPAIGRAVSFAFESATQ